MSTRFCHTARLVAPALLTSLPLQTHDLDDLQSFSMTARPGPGQMSQADLPPPMKHLVNDPALQAMAAEAASNVAEAVRCQHFALKLAVQSNVQYMLIWCL